MLINRFYPSENTFRHRRSYYGGVKRPDMSIQREEMLMGFQKAQK